MQHTKSPCCRAPIRRYGNRRRQCSLCLKTWRLHKHKRGRKPNRIRSNLLRSLFENRFTLGHLLCAHPKLSPSRTLFRFRKQLTQQAALTLNTHLPRGPLVLLVDGFWFRFQSHIWVLYICAAKPMTSSLAWILTAQVIKGKENFAAWRKVISSLLPKILKHIEAFVSDGFRGSARIAKNHAWIHQRCHYHLLAQLYKRQGCRKKTLEQQSRRRKIIKLVRSCLTETNRRSVAQLRSRLRKEIDDPLCPVSFRQVVREFLRHFEAFRAYLNHPQMNLPATTSCLESYGKELRRYTKHLCTPKSLSKWSKVYVKYHPTVVCNGKNINQI